MINFLYCFDENYNMQALTSIYSLLNNSNEKINISILHNKPESFKKIYLKFINKSSLVKIEFYKFTDNNYDFPRINNTHISAATYFRIFINNYLDKDLKSVFYFDADTVFNKNIISELKEISSSMLSKNILFAASSEPGADIATKRLGMNNEKYFNAGVLGVNLVKWRHENVHDQLIKILETRYDDILWWDQDILNIFSDGDYLEIDKDLNSRTNFHSFKLNESVKVYHFLGDLKPWHPETIGSEYSEIYQSIFREVTNKKYHIDLKKKSFKLTTTNIFKHNILSRLDYPFSFLKHFIQKVLKYLLRL